MRQHNNIYNIKNHENEFFGTQEWVRDKLYEMMPKNVKTILDPCAGDYGLEDFSKSYEYTLYDITPLHPDIIEQDFLKLQRDKNAPLYDAVVLNPPFQYTNEFIKKAFEFSDDIYLIAPIKTTCKDWRNNIVDFYGNWRISYQCFGVLTSIGIFHLKYNTGFSFGPIIDPYKEFLMAKLPEEKTLKSVYMQCAEHIYNDKPFIVHKITKARVLRNEPLIYDSDIHLPGDDSVFIAEAANAKVKKGDRILRYIQYFDTIEDAREFKEKYDIHQEYIRNYCYEWGSNMLGLNEIPLLD